MTLSIMGFWLGLQYQMLIPSYVAVLKSDRMQLVTPIIDSHYNTRGLILTGWLILLHTGPRDE